MKCAIKPMTEWKNRCANDSNKGLYVKILPDNTPYSEEKVDYIIACDVSLVSRLC